jgi:hypothetical protein
MKMTMTDFSHLHELEERAKRTQSQMLRVQKNDAEWNQLAIQLFQTEQEIADERTFLGLKDMDASKLYAELLDDHESEVAMQVIESTADRPLWEKHKEQERQALIAALAERDRLDPDAPNAIAFKHDPYCDCGICQYCRGDEDKFGNPTRSKEVESIREKVLITASIECSECDDAKTENLQGGNLRTLRPEFAMIVWKYGWVVELDKVLCPNCRADAEEWSSI